MYQYGNDFKLNISNRCCYELKKNPIHEWAHGRIAITGMMRNELGQRTHLACITKTTFNPFAKIDEDWENQFVKEKKSNYANFIIRHIISTELDARDAHTMSVSKSNLN
jgi:hypothetical protein